MLDDADLGRAVPGALRGVNTNSGHCCVSIERIYAHSSLYDEFAARLAEAFAGVRLGNSLAFDEDMGSLASADQLAKGRRSTSRTPWPRARVLAGGRPGPTSARTSSSPRCWRTCRRAPLRPRGDVRAGRALYRFDTEDEVVAQANDTPTA